VKDSVASDTPKRLKELLISRYNYTKLSLLKSNRPELISDLVTFEEKHVIQKAKIGVLLVKEGQTEQDDMFANNENTPAFTEFLRLMGDEVVLKGFPNYRGGLDTKWDATGKTSYYSRFAGLEIMYHVSTLLPHFPYDKQQLEKKRHLGNDICVIVFNESSRPFTANVISSQFNQIYAVVAPLTIDDIEYYKIDFVIKDGVPLFGPPLPDAFLIEKGPEFRNILLTKILNGERAAYASPAFLPKLKKTRQQLLEEIVQQYN